MNKALKLSAIGAALFLTFGCNQEQSTAQTCDVELVDALPAQAIEQIIELQTLEQQAAYAIGASFSKYLVTSLNQPKELGINLENSDVFQGIHDSFSGNVQLTKEEIEEVLKQLDKLVADKLTEYSTVKQLEVIKQGKEYRESFKQQENVTVLDSGLMVKIHEDGRGKKPIATDTITVHYRGTLTDGTSFDSSYDRGEPATFPLEQVIEGWTEGLQQVNVGSKVTLVIPPELAYGDQSTPSIPGGSTLVFDIELLSIE